MSAPEYHRSALRLLDRTGIFMAEISYFSVNSDGILELARKMKAVLSLSTSYLSPLCLGKLTQPNEIRYSSGEAWIPMAVIV
jgi:hypothetical protein